MGRVYLSGDSCQERSEPRCCASSITFTLGEGGAGGADRHGIVCFSVCPLLSGHSPGLKIDALFAASTSFIMLLSTHVSLYPPED